MNIDHCVINFSNGSQEPHPIDCNHEFTSVHECAVYVRRKITVWEVGHNPGFVTGAFFTLCDPVKNSCRVVNVTRESYCVTFVRKFTKEEKYLPNPNNRYA